jgi:hypothetical protein
MGAGTQGTIGIRVSRRGNPIERPARTASLTTALNPERRFLLQHVSFDKLIVRAEGCDLYDERGVRPQNRSSGEDRGPARTRHLA